MSSFGSPETYVLKLLYQASGTGPDVSNSGTPVPMQFTISASLDQTTFQEVDEAEIDVAFAALVDAVDGLVGFSCTLAGKDKDVLVVTPPA